MPEFIGNMSFLSDHHDLFYIPDGRELSYQVIWSYHIPVNTDFFDEVRAFMLISGRL